MWKEHFFSFFSLPPFDGRPFGKWIEPFTVSILWRTRSEEQRCMYLFIIFSTHIHPHYYYRGASEQASKQTRVNEEAIDQIMNAKRFNNIILIHSILVAGAKWKYIRMGWLAKAAAEQRQRSERRTVWRSQDTFICFMEFLNFIRCESTYQMTETRIYITFCLLIDTVHTVLLDRRAICLIF